LSYAGVFCAILLLLLPAMMVLSGRKINIGEVRYRVPGGRITPWIVILFACATLVNALLNRLN